MFADEIPPEYLWCKDMRHAWSPDSEVAREVFNRRTEHWEIWRTVRCDNCGTHKTQKLDKAFRPVTSPTYDYPPGYKVEGHRGYIMTADDRARIRARNIALRGGVTKTPKPKKVQPRKRKTA